MTDDIARAIDAHEGEALADMVCALPLDVAERLGARVERVDGATAMMVSATGNAYLNRIVGLGVEDPAREDDVRRLVDGYRDAGTSVLVHVSPHAQPAELSDWLLDEGLEPEPNWVGVFRGPEPLPEVELDPALRIERAGPADAEVFARTLVEGYGMPDEWAPLWEHVVGRDRWRNWLVYDGDEPVATGSLFIDGVRARMCNGAVKRSHRKRRIHVAFLRHRLAAAIGEGCTVLTGETWEGTEAKPNPARRSHDRLGIRAAYVRRNFIHRPY